MAVMDAEGDGMLVSENHPDAKEGIRLWPVVDPDGTPHVHGDRATVQLPPMVVELDTEFGESSNR